MASTPSIQNIPGYREQAGQYQRTDEKAKANGYASLDGSTTVPVAQIPASIARTTDLSSYQLSSAKGAANGYASLDGSTTVPVSQIPSSIARTTDLTAYQPTSEKNVAGGYAGLSTGSTRVTKGIDTQDDLIIDLATKGLVLKDTQASPHYWRLTVTTTGGLTTSDLGTAKP